MNTPRPSPLTDPDQPTADLQALDDRVVLGGRYRLGEVIGRGGMAEVYRAEDLRLARQVAVKILLDDLGDGTDRDRFIGEAKTLAMLSHSGLVTVLDAGFGVTGQRPAATDGANDRPFLVMELVDGATMTERMKAGPMTTDELGPVAAQIAEALAYVHSRGVVHRDVKPGNVLIGRDGTVKLADFGIARLMEQRSRHTRTGVAMGTAAYIAPEQVNGATVDGAADVFALGLVLLEAATGRREYAGPPAEAALARLTRPPEIPPLGPGWHDLLTRMTALDPGSRPSAADVGEWLRARLSEPAPVGTVGVPDAATSPILAQEPRTAPGGLKVTKPLTGAAGPGAERRQPLTSAIDRGSDALARQVRLLGGRLRELPSETWGVAGAIGALLLFMIVLAVARGDDAPPTIPGNTPAELREPLTDLHQAVNGDD